MEKTTWLNLLYFLFALFGLWMVQQWWQRAQSIEVVPYSQFEVMLADGRIA